MRLTKFLAAAAALSLAAVPALADTINPAASLSLGSSARHAGSGKHKSDVIASGVIIALVAGAAVVGGVVAVADNSSSR